MRPLVSVIKQREAVETPKRQRLTKYEFAVLFLNQQGRCGCGCGKRLEAGKIDEEHTLALSAGGENPKPDSLWRRDCHKAKTKGDVKAKAKIDRLTGKTGQRARMAKRGPVLKSNRKLESRGFDKRLRKRMDGTVETRPGE